MENMELYAMPSSPSLFHMLESEEDFPLGAKTTSFLPPATVTNAAASTTNTTTTAAYDLPDWMEGRDILGLPATLSLPPSLQGSVPQQHTIFQLDDDNFTPAIKPEDMLVPLSELQPPPATPAINHLGLIPPPALTPPATPPHTATPPPRPITPPTTQANPPIPKIIICRKVTTAAAKSRPIQVNFQVLPAKQVPQVILTAPQVLPAVPPSPSLPSKKSHERQVGTVTFGGSQVEQQAGSMALAQPQPQPQPAPPSVQPPQTCDADELIDEIVQMIGSSGSSTTGVLQGLEGVDVSTMEDLLSQLEAIDSPTTSVDTNHSASSSLSPHMTSVPALSPQPSESSLSSLSVSLPSQSPSDFASSPNPSEISSLPSPAYLPSPVPSVGSLSPAPSTGESLYGESASCDDMKSLDEEWSPLEETHSYSRSQRKARSSRRTAGARKTPYLEDRKERKKEQNKQAALRYRQKKKQEEDDLIEKIEAEEERQKKLTAKYSGLKQEMSYLKKIMREVFMAKGLLSEEALKKAALERKKSIK